MKAIDSCWTLVLLLCAGCEIDPFGGHGCTEIGCGDNVALTLRTPDNTWPDGHYAFEFTFDQELHTCAIDLPAELRGPGATSPLRCEPQLDASFSPHSICPTPRPNDNTRPACTLVRDAWLVEASKFGTPDSVRVRITRDAAEVFSASEKPKYETSRPNGPDCEPECKTSRLELRLN